ncbi:hypothetical protein LUZ62_028884 [Rhynchospora pubera]|uniref:poly(ADP-ribose) glycohydrolase n=1 Tax=Rhynchospora pubera TaxID=906938 RepID=A0AAV8HNF9_9POAL|nr:hypothetical protein LUZ62_028884 [Rhynchospora pubera]
MDHLSGANSMLPFLPISISTTSNSSLSHFAWPEEAESALKDLKLGPTVSHVDSGAKLFDFICKLRDGLGFSSQPPLALRASNGFSLFFDQYMSRDEAKVWFDKVVPGLGALLLRLPSLLDAHYCKSNKLTSDVNCELRILSSQDAGIVILNQELIAALLSCAFFCLFPTKDRASKHLPIINFDQLFDFLADGWRQLPRQKFKCFVHYFERICNDTPNGVISFERKVLPLHFDADFWLNSDAPLCPIKIFTSHLIEDQPHDALEVIFSNESFGGNSLDISCVYKGCDQEQMRFLINPELVGGMLFMTSMENNEAIEVVGVQRYIRQKWRGSTFFFTGEFLDKKPVDSMGRRKTGLVAMDALNKPIEEQYETNFLLREVNKAFVGFKRSKYESNIFESQDCKQPSGDGKTVCGSISNGKENGDENQNEQGNGNQNGLTVDKAEIFCNSTEKQNKKGNKNGNKKESDNENLNANALVGIATGNWECREFGGNPQIRFMIQWIAASQSNRPFIHYYTDYAISMERAEQAIEWIVNKKWNVGDLWTKVVDYSSRKLEGETTEDLFSWLQPARNDNVVHAGINTFTGSKRDPHPTRQDDRPNRAKRKPVWLNDYVTVMR